MIGQKRKYKSDKPNGTKIELDDGFYVVNSPSWVSLVAKKEDPPKYKKKAKPVTEDE